MPHPSLLILPEPSLIEICGYHLKKSPTFPWPCCSTSAEQVGTVNSVLPLAGFTLIISMTNPDGVRLWQGLI